MTSATDGMSIVEGALPRDVVAYAWYALGVRPRESLVVVGLGGDRMRVGLVARIDLPSPRRAREIAGAVVEMLDKAREDACLLLVVSDATGAGPLRDPGGRMPQVRLVDRLGAALTAMDVDVVDVLLVGPDAFLSYLCGGDGCCPDEGHPLSSLADSPVAAAMVLDGRTVAPDEATLVVDVDPATARARGESALRRPVRRPERGRLVAAYEQWCADLAADADRPSRPQALLAAVCTDRGVRDAVMASMLPGGAGLAARLAAGERTEDDEWPADERPDPDLAVTGRRLLAALARRAPSGARGRVLAALAWLAWLDGDPVRGRVLAGRALEDVPEESLALLVEMLLETGTAPGWCGADEPVPLLVRPGEAGRAAD